MENIMETGSEQLKFSWIEFDLDWMNPQKANLMRLRGKQAHQKNYKQLTNSVIDSSRKA
tara:strand:+ start:523 stop:699 length:177 start_codon:yes stop_codon:yes gene_type:complete